jgi:hypothetical protein
VGVEEGKKKRKGKKRTGDEATRRRIVWARGKEKLEGGERDEQKERRRR